MGLILCSLNGDLSGSRPSFEAQILYFESGKIVVIYKRRCFLEVYAFLSVAFLHFEIGSAVAGLIFDTNNIIEFYLN